MAEGNNVMPVNYPTGETVQLVGRPCELSAFSFIPTKRDAPKERTYFNCDKQERYSSSTYDRLFTQDYGYEKKLHRDDREHANARGLSVNAEERAKVVPSLASSVYGHRLPEELDPPTRKHVRIAEVRTEFFRRNNINVKPPMSIDDY